MTNDTEKLPTKAMIEAGCAASGCQTNRTIRAMVKRIYLAMQSAAPKDEEMVERDLLVELTEAANILHKTGDFDLRDAVREARDSISGKA